MEPEGSLPHSHDPPISPFRDPYQASPCPPSQFLKIQFNIMLTSICMSSKWCLPLSFFHQNSGCTTPVPFTCHMLRPSHSSRFDHPNSIWLGVQIVKFLVMWSSSHPCFFVPLRSKYYPQHPILEHLRPMFVPQCDRPTFTPIQKTDKFILLHMTYLLFFG